MSTRLENAIHQLPQDKLDELADYAEYLAMKAAGASAQPQHLKLDWVGAAADAYPEDTSGVEAAHAVMAMMRDAVEKGLAR